MSDPIAPVLSAVPVYDNTRLQALFTAQGVVDAAQNTADAAAIAAQAAVDAAQNARLDALEASY